MPRVLIVGQGPPTSGGIPTFVTMLMRNKWLNEHFDLRYFNTAPTSTKLPGGMNFSNLWLTVLHAVAIYRRAGTSDVVHLNLAPAPLLPLLRAVILCLSARAAAAKVILHAHSGRIEIGARQIPYRLFLRLILRLADSTIVVSKPAQMVTERLGRRALHVQNCVDRNEFGRIDDSVGPPVLAFVGTVCERKGLLDLRDALVCLRARSGSALPLRVLIAGDSQQEGPEVFERVKKAYEDEGLAEVEFLGPLEHSDIVNLLAKTSIFCLPSHWEGAPLSLLEAMAAGTAVVATNVGDIPTMLEDGHAGLLIEPHDPDALASAIDRLISSPAERRRLGAAAVRKVESSYDCQKLAHKLSALYWALADYSR